jgi:signal transduction histidine kinase
MERRELHRSTGRAPRREHGAKSRRADDERLALDLADLLAGAVQRVAEVTGARSAVAWGLDAHGDCFHATGVGAVAPDLPSERTMAALLGLSCATDLRAPGVDPILAQLVDEKGFDAAVPVARIAAGGETARPIAAILIGLHKAERVRPRTLAALDQTAKRLRAPITTALAIARLAELDDEVLRMARMATLGDLLAEVVHEVRNPLVSVKTFLQMLPGHLDDPDFHTNFRQVVLDEARRMERLLDSLLHQARPKHDDEHDVRASLGATIESVGRLLEKRAQAKDLALTIDVGADLPDVAIDEDPLRQIVLNLALNALEATPEGGKVRLAAASASSASVGTPEAVEFIVDDEGPGIREEDRARLFDPFFSTRSERPIGLGLTVCSRLARDAKGTIRAEDSPQGGARLRVWLPVSAP